MGALSSHCVERGGKKSFHPCSKERRGKGAPVRGGSRTTLILSIGGERKGGKKKKGSPIP